MHFKKIVILDKIALTENTIREIGKYSENTVDIFNSDPKDSNETIERLAEADCVLLSWRTSITKEIIEACPNLKFICLCATNASLIDLKECSKNKITVSNVKDYGDIGVVEWIFFELLNLIRGFGSYQWREQPSELCGKVFGIIGLGTIGKMVADIALCFNMKVIYFSKERDEEYEKRGVLCTKKKELLQKSDFITLQTPKNVVILDKSDFDLMQGKVLINNTLGKAFKESNLIKWIKEPNNYLIMDMATDFKSDFKDLDRVILSNVISGQTGETVQRLCSKALDNITGYLNERPINKID
ncbi:dihydrofolate reductase [Patescibacteria group bacterium]|nr:dihydrofolate reductase [Patescibacteria group bacterium]